MRLSCPVCYGSLGLLTGESHLRVGRGKGIEGQSRHGHVVDADDVDALGRQAAGSDCRHEVAVSERRLSLAGLLDEFAEKSLPRVTDQNWAAEVEEAAGLLHEFQIVLVSLAKTDAGIEADGLKANACVQQAVAALAEVGVDFCNDIGVLRRELHGLGCALHVHRTNAGPACSGYGGHRRITLKAGDIVDDLCARIECLLGHGRLGGVDRNRQARFGRQPPHDLADSLPLFFRRHRIGKRSGAFATHIKNVSPGGCQRQTMPNGGVDVGMSTPVGETVRGDIDDAHQQRRCCCCGQGECPGSQLPDGGTT